MRRARLDQGSCRSARQGTCAGTRPPTSADGHILGAGGSRSYRCLGLNRRHLSGMSLRPVKRICAAACQPRHIPRRDGLRTPPFWASHFGVAARSARANHPASISETPAGDAGLKLEAALYCEPCSEGRHYSRQQGAHIFGLTYARPDPEQPRMLGRKTGRKPLPAKPFRSPHKKCTND
jgi:hypothetical protein